MNATTIQRSPWARPISLPTVLLGGDFGNATALLSNSGAATPQIPSYISTGDDLGGLIATRLGAGGSANPTAGQLNVGEIVIFHENMTYFVGELAIAEGHSATAAIGDSSRYHNGHTLILLLALASQLYPTETQITAKLVTGVPPKLLKEQPQIKQQIARSLGGEHSYIVHDTHGTRAIKLTITGVQVVMEGVIALAALGESGRPMGVLDIGGHSVDPGWFDANGRVVDARTGSMTGAGTDRIGELVSQEFRKQHGRALTPAEIQDVLHSYLYGMQAAVYHRGAQTVPAAWIEHAIATTGKQVNTYLSQLWGNSDGSTAADGAFVLMIGGGARYHHLHPTIKIDTEIRHIDKPEGANALSYAMFADRVEQRQAWPRLEV